MLLPKLPLSTWVNVFVKWLYKMIGPELTVMAHIMRLIIHAISGAFLFLPWWFVIMIFASLAYYTGRWRFAIGSVVGLLLIYDLGLWNHFMITLVLVILASLVSVIVGLPLGIWSAKSERVYRVLAPILDLMQTMPAFVYLVPVLIFFSIGVVSAILATVIFAMPPIIRLTRLGILQVPEDLVEAAKAFGTDDRQLLWKVQMPLAKPSIKAGINQTIMLSLSMVVIASMIGAGGLGANVMSALATINVGKGFDAGISIVILAILLDRISQKMGG